MTALLSPWFWLNPDPMPMMPMIQTGLLVLFTAVFVLGVAAHVFRFRGGVEKLTRRALERAGNCLLTCGLLGLLWLACSYERIPYLGMRLMFLVILAIAMWWTYTIYRYVWIEIPKIKAEHQQQAEFNKWLPKRKKK